MTYKETVKYLFSQLPMFEKQGATGFREGLANTLALDEHLGHPHRHYATIHVAGTNGKGSVSHSIAAVLQTCGYRVGLYTSPHLVDFRERIRVDGTPVGEDFVVDFVANHRAFFEPLHPSFFEITTAMAFKYFEEEKVDIAVIEVGLGGRLDCTNIITPVLSVITNISMDHTQMLGDTLAKIAREKAGIIKRGVPVVVGETTTETRPVFMQAAKEKGAPVAWAEESPYIVGADFSHEGKVIYTTRYGYTIENQLCGHYQARNLNTVLKALQTLGTLGYPTDCMAGTDKAKRLARQQAALKNVCGLTGLQGRWQQVREMPKVVCDTGHNTGAWQYLGKQIAHVACNQLRIVFGMVSDKDVDGVLQLLPKDAVYYFTKANSHRATPEEKLRKMAARHGLNGDSYPTVDQAYGAALGQAGCDDFIFVGGSSYVVADFLEAIH